MDMPTPGVEHERLGRLAGNWEGEETLHPSPWDPAGGKATGRYSWRVALDGFYVVGDYEQERDGAVNFQGHAVIGFDGPKQEYAMYWFDSTGFLPSSTATGPCEGDTFTLSHTDQMGHHRYRWTVRGDEMSMDIGASPDGTEWSTFLEGTYRRA